MKPWPAHTLLSAAVQQRLVTAAAINPTTPAAECRERTRAVERAVSYAQHEHPKLFKPADSPRED